MGKFPEYIQLDLMDCGPTCLRMIAKHYGRNINLQTLRDKCGIGREGVSLLGISRAAEAVGFHTRGVLLNFDELATDALLPCIIHWNQEHFVVVHKVRKNKVFVADPARGLITYPKAEFCQQWLSAEHEGEAKGIALLLEPTADFATAYEAEREYGTGRFLKLLLPHKKLLIQLFAGLLAGSLLQLIFPFLSQAIVDVGISHQNMHFIYLVLLAQVMLFLGRISIEFIRGWILLHISSRISLTILSDFLIKLMRLPMSFFDVKLFGDVMQRMSDQRRVESFLTSSSLESVFSLLNLLVFSGVLLYFNKYLFAVFAVASALYIAWNIFFLRRRRTLDFRRFEVQAKEQSALVELVSGMQDIKLANAEIPKRWRWEGLRARLFRLNTKALALTQYQQAGAHLINEGKNILATFLAAKAVLTGNMTLGTMLAVQYIIGQLNGPIEQLMQFMQLSQEASISMERLNEIHAMADEEPLDRPVVSELPESQDLSLRNVSFGYGGRPVLDGVSLHIPAGRTTAIVGGSGSGKTTLLKLLLHFYAPEQGDIRVGGINLQHLSRALWRSTCGVVMQDGFIFSDTIAHNIAVGESQFNVRKLLHAVRVANIQDYIESLPLGYNTRIGPEGSGLSQGQKQRILIARAVYKNPEFIFFDEATNALDASNERTILRNLEEFFRGRTVVVVAHRLSTVRQADQIIVLDQGRVAEQGTHQELLARRGHYFALVHNQLELSA
jgi:ATP-binding cassette, subfamily B, bacterial